MIQNPIFFLLIPIIVIVFYFSSQKKKEASIKFSSEKFLKINKPNFKCLFYKNLWILRLIVLILLIFGLARFRLPNKETKIKTEGIDIVLVLDTSTSMLAEDFKIAGRRLNRLEVVKKIVEDFIKLRKNDRLSIVAFASKAYPISPLTLDHNWLLENLKRVKIGLIEDGTAIGSAIIVALKRLENSTAKSKIIILLTDGINNAGNISPSLAAETARSLKVKIYTIGVGTKGMAPYPVKDFFGNTVYKLVKIDVDEETLIDIASKTGGKFFRAQDAKSLKEIYNEIDRLEKSPLEEKDYTEYKELFPIFVLPALAVLILEIILKGTWLIKIP
ncbi:MAG: VWA domain-containing protein [Candidatus Omnitrophica bacterium]|nr:VWA domain-containing protein [Candidatus Omnitrophota bacterium]MCM8832242.1 VWA domain-containing protein [Candidatus Omnitrophota bacterium]